MKSKNYLPVRKRCYTRKFYCVLRKNCRSLQNEVFLRRNYINLPDKIRCSKEYEFYLLAIPAAVLEDNVFALQIPEKFLSWHIRTPILLRAPVCCWVNTSKWNTERSFHYHGLLHLFSILKKMKR